MRSRTSSGPARDRSANTLTQFVRSQTALDHAKEFKKQGNEKYKEGMCEEAKQLYSDAIDLLSTDIIHSQVNEVDIARVKSECLCNRSLVTLLVAMISPCLCYAFRRYLANPEEKVLSPSDSGSDCQSDRSSARRNQA